MTKTLLILTVLLEASWGYCQLPAGTWEGNFGRVQHMIQPLKIILELERVNDSFYRGISHLYYEKGKYEHYTIKAKFNPRDSTLDVREDSTIRIKALIKFRFVRGTYYLKMATNGDLTYLDGGWLPHNRFFWDDGPFPSYFVPVERKKDEQALTAINGSTETVAITRGNSDDKSVLARRNEVQSLVELNPNQEDSIRVDIYDNGIVDEDTVSLYLDDRLIISRSRITAQPITLFIKIRDLKPISKLKLIANSLGNIPPCTALIKIHAQGKWYEVTLTSNLEMNGVVEFFLRL
jgi:hypothetical protein